MVTLFGTLSYGDQGAQKQTNDNRCDSVTLIAYIEHTSSPSCPSSSFAQKIKPLSLGLFIFSSQRWFWFGLSLISCKAGI